MVKQLWAPYVVAGESNGHGCILGAKRMAAQKRQKKKIIEHPNPVEEKWDGFGSLQR